MIHVFDLDGTLVDSRDAVVASYADVGILMPSDAWGKPWGSWLPALAGSLEAAQEVHLRKNEAYMLRVAQVRPMPLARVLRELWNKAGIYTSVLTGASHHAAHLLLGRVVGVDLSPMNPHGTMLQAERDLVGKAHALAALASVHDDGIYYDDDLHTCEIVDQFLTTVGATRNRWSVCHVR